MHKQLTLFIFAVLYFLIRSALGSATTCVFAIYDNSDKKNIWSNIKRARPKLGQGTTVNNTLKLIDMMENYNVNSYKS